MLLNTSNIKNMEKGGHFKSFYNIKVDECTIEECEKFEHEYVNKINK